MDVFFESLDRTLGSALQAEGFIGEPGKWKRFRNPVINCIEIQSRSDQEACSVNLGVHFVFLPSAGSSSGVDLLSSEPSGDPSNRRRHGWNQSRSVSSNVKPCGVPACDSCFFAADDSA